MPEERKTRLGAFVDRFDECTNLFPYSAMMIGGKGDIFILEAPRMSPTPPDNPVQQTWNFDNEDELFDVVRRFVGRLCPAWFSPDQRDDLFQETCLRLTQLDPERQREFSSSFLWQTTTYVRNELRRRFRRHSQYETAMPSSGNPAEPDAKPYDPPDPRLDPEAEFVRCAELGRKIRECLPHLPPDQRRVVTLRLLGYPQREIVGRLGYDARKVDNHCTRGMKKLRQMLAEYWSPT